ncbi:unnamed protein product, partial [Mesorhabditis belari]|uniref:Uncharacterized protein n=1 Tax=Mesorhabditis belari TaxID=2138241 RepID=A0AAF3FMU2_9BILA
MSVLQSRPSSSQTWTARSCRFTDSFAKIVKGKVKMEQTAAAPILSDSLRLSSRESRCSIDEGTKEYSEILKASILPNINDPDGTNRSIVKREAEDRGWAIFSAQVHDTFVRVQQFSKSYWQLIRIKWV